MSEETYLSRPWLNLYPQGTPTDIDAEYTTGLAVFDAAVAAHPHEPFLLYFDGSLSFAQVDRAARALAVTLRERGFTDGDRLALYTQNNPAFVIGMISAWRAGGTAVAINPMNKARELTYLLGDSGAVALLALDDLYTEVAKPVIDSGKTSVTTVITSSALDFQTRNDDRLFHGLTRLHPAGTLDLVTIIDDFAGGELPAVTLSADDVAVLAYTSGTTGEPKGAINTHGNFAFNAQTYRDWTGLKPGEPILGIAPLFHITGLVGHVMFATLAGSPLVLNHRFDPRVALDAIREHRPVFTVAAITAFNALA
ncbi:MAG: AMP-binding protein, partial [Gordonia sp. (in: high G+C Gram-positive bacteria)]